MVQLYS